MSLAILSNAWEMSKRSRAKVKASLRSLSLLWSSMLGLSGCSQAGGTSGVGCCGSGFTLVLRLPTFVAADSPNTGFLSCWTAATHHIKSLMSIIYYNKSQEIWPYKNESISLTVTSHAHSQTFLKPTILTTISMVFGNFTTLASPALIAQLLADAAFKKALATLATNRSVVPAASSISTNYTEF